MTEENKAITEDDLEEKIKKLSAKLKDIETRYTNLQQQVENISTNVEDLSNKLAEITNNFSDSENKINTTLQQFNNTIAEYNNRLNSLETQADTYKTNTETKIEELDTRIEEWMGENTEYLDNSKESIEKLLTEVKEYIEDKETKTDELYETTTDNFTEKEEELARLIKQYQTDIDVSVNKIDKLNTEAINSNSKIKQIEADSVVFKETVDEYINNMQEAAKNISAQILMCKEKTDEAFKKNDDLTIQIEEQLQKATGISLFHTFQKRKEDLEKTQAWWLVGVIISTIALIIISLKVMGSLQHLPANTPIDWFKDVVLKFTLSMPILYLLYFFTDRYTKTRRLIEEYAFKSTISLALKPYFDLIKGLDGEEEEKDKNFLIAVIGNIFTTPTDKVFRTTEKQYTLDFSNYYKSIADIIKPVENKENNG